MYRLRVSENGRYFVDQKGVPIFWMGTTQWPLVRDHTLEEATLILDRIASIGFAVAGVMILGSSSQEGGIRANVHGEKPWIHDNPLAPNEGYFEHVDAVVEVARQKNVIISMILYHQRWREYITLENARAWARWVARRYRDVPTIMWSLVPEAKPEFVPVLRELAAGLREGDGGSHLITAHPDPGPFSSSFCQAEPWLDFNSIQTWTWVEAIYPLVTEDYSLAPVKPVLMTEGAYEKGSEYDFEVTPLWVRRQAYYSYLAGAHHTYGHNDSWRALPNWREALDAPGAIQLGLLKRIFQEREEWWGLVPDQSLFASGGQIEGRVLTLAARHKDGKWAMVYCAAATSFAIDMSKLAGTEAEACWIDPRSAESVAIGRVAKGGEQAFSTPEGWEDALLVLEASDGRTVGI
jgi:hypothetical protein